MQTASAFQKEMRALANPEKAILLARFFKTGKGQYGEGDKFLGLTVPQTRMTVKKYLDLSLKELEKILQSKFHEERLGALFVLVSQFKKGDRKVQEKIFKFYLKNTEHINSWDLVDLSAHHIVGAHLADKPKDLLFKLAVSESLLERRIAMVATFFDIAKEKSETALAVAEKLLDDKEDLMHKAVGWMLREVGKRCSQKIEEEFLKKHYSRMPRTTLRYAIERFPEQKRKAFLKGEF